MTDQLSSDLASLRIDRAAPAPRRPSSIKTIALAAVGVAVLAAIGVVAYGRLTSQLFKKEVRTTEVAMISPSQAEVQVTATGYVIPQRTSKVGSKLPGRLAEVLVKEGDTVQEGDIIARLDDVDQRSKVAGGSARVGVASARIAAAKANVAELSQQVERERALVDSGARGKATLDDLVARQQALEAMVRAAKADRNAAAADLGTIGVELKDRVIVAPLSGRIVTKPATVGEYVGGFANVGAIAEIVDFTSLLVEVDVPEARLHQVKIGSPCEIVLDAYPSKRYRGEAVERGLRVNRSKATLMVKVKFVDSMEDVLPEMSARVSFLSKAISDDAMKEAPKKVVSNEAIVERQGQKVVFTIDGGKLHAIPVKLGGAVGGSATELLDGPPPGTKVVVKPAADAAEGQRIKESEQ